MKIFVVVFVDLQQRSKTIHLTDKQLNEDHNNSDNFCEIISKRNETIILQRLNESMMKDIVEESSIFIQKIQQQSRSISIRTCTINVENLQVITRKTELQDRIIANYIMKLIKLNRASEKFIRVSSVRLVLVSFRNFLMLLVCVRFSNKLFMKMKFFCFFFVKGRRKSRQNDTKFTLIISFYFIIQIFKVIIFFFTLFSVHSIRL